MFGRMIRAGEGWLAGADGDEPRELDKRLRHQCLVVLQWLQDRGYVQTLVVLEQESGLRYSDGDLPIACMLESSLDMFGSYRDEGHAGAEVDSAAIEVEEELQQQQRGICCTNSAGGCEEPLNANVTAVAWVPAGHGELLALAATADRQLRLLDSRGEVVASLQGLSSPVLSLDTAAGATSDTYEVLLTEMGGEVNVLELRHGTSEEVASWALEMRQRFSDHLKHVNSGRFAPPVEEGQPSARFITVSKDHQAHVYARGDGEFSRRGTVRLAGEVTCCCWAGEQTFVLAAREDHHLHYWDVGEGINTPTERLKVNLNAMGDSVVSFAVLALAASPNGKMIAACTDKSRVIVLQAFSNRQLRNLYGAIIDEYDVPSVSFSLDSTFVYATSSLSAPLREAKERLGADGGAMLGEVVVFEVRSGELVLKLPCHTKAVRCMSRHPLEEALVTGSFDRTVRFWS